MITVVKMSKSYNAGVYYIGRPSPWGNPFLALDYGRGGAIRKFAEWWYAPAQKKLREMSLREIPTDCKLGCWCSPQSCHGDIIAGYINWKRSL